MDEKTIIQFLIDNPELKDTIDKYINSKIIINIAGLIAVVIILLAVIIWIYKLWKDV